MTDSSRGEVRLGRWTWSCCVGSWWGRYLVYPGFPHQAQNLPTRAPAAGEKCNLTFFTHRAEPCPVYPARRTQTSPGSKFQSPIHHQTREPHLRAWDPRSANGHHAPTPASAQQNSSLDSRSTPVKHLQLSYTGFKLGRLVTYTTRLSFSPENETRHRPQNPNLSCITWCWTSEAGGHCFFALCRPCDGRMQDGLRMP